MQERYRKMREATGSVFPMRKKVSKSSRKAGDRIGETSEGENKRGCRKCCCNEGFQRELYLVATGKWKGEVSP